MGKGNPRQRPPPSVILNNEVHNVRQSGRRWKGMVKSFYLGESELVY